MQTGTEGPGEGGGREGEGGGGGSGRLEERVTRFSNARGILNIENSAATARLLAAQANKQASNRTIKRRYCDVEEVTDPVIRSKVTPDGAMINVD
jgi:hypothetical protein